MLYFIAVLIGDGNRITPAIMQEEAEATAQQGLRDPLAGNFGYQLRRASVQMMAGLAAALEETGLRVTEASVLLVIHANPGASQSDIGRLLGIRRANMAPLAGTLELRGLIARAPVDGRSHALRTTDAGAALAERAKAITLRHEARLTEGLDRAAAAIVLAHLRGLRAG